jgi:hypothetical protein
MYFFGDPLTENRMLRCAFPHLGMRYGDFYKKNLALAQLWNTKLQKNNKVLEKEES